MSKKETSHVQAAEAWEFLAAASLSARGCRGSWRARGSRRGRRPQLHEQRAPTRSWRARTADVLFELEKSKGRGRQRRRSPRGDRPGSASGSPSGIAGGFDDAGPGHCMRELHWARHRSRVGVCMNKGRVRTTVLRPGGTRRRMTSAPGDVWYFRARPRPRMLEMPRPRAVPLRPDLRRRQFLRVRDLQHHRLGRPHPQGAAGEELRPPGIGLRGVPEEGGVFRPRGSAARAGGRPARGPEKATNDAQVAAPRQRPDRQQQGRVEFGSGWSIPPSSPSPKPSPAQSWNSSRGRYGSCTGTPPPTSGSTSSRGRPASRCSVRADATGPRRLKRATSVSPSAGVRALDRKRRQRREVPRLDRVQTPESTRTSICRNGSAAIRPTCSPPTSVGFGFAVRAVPPQGCVHRGQGRTPGSPASEQR